MGLQGHYSKRVSGYKELNIRGGLALHDAYNEV